jgi:hypothetical protein
VTLRTCSQVIACTLFCLALSTASFAGSKPDITHFGSDISIAAGEEVGEATCFGCTVHIRGHVEGDVTAIGGNIVIEAPGQIGGEATAIIGGMRLDQGVSIGGDVTVMGGRIRRDASSSIGGEITNFAGIWWILLIFGLPLAFLGGCVALLVLLVRRITRPPLPVTA